VPESFLEWYSRVMTLTGPDEMTGSALRVGEVLELHRAFWHRKELAKPLLNVEAEGRTHARRALPRKLEPLSLPLKHGMATKDMSLQPWMLEPEKIHPAPDDTQQPLDLPRTYGDVFQVLAPCYKIPWVEEKKKKKKNLRGKKQTRKGKDKKKKKPRAD